MARTSSPRGSLALGLILLATACVDVRAGTTPPSATPSRAIEPTRLPVTVAYLQDATLPDDLEILAPAQLAIRLALQEAVERGELPPGSDVVAVDVSGGSEAELAAATRVAGTSDVVAAVIAPMTVLSADAVEVLAEAGLAVVSLSSVGPWPPNGASIRLVAPLAREAAAVAELLRRRSPACLAGEGTTAFSDRAHRALVRVLRDRARLLPSPVAVAPWPGQDGCRAVVWTGPASGAAALRTELDRVGAERIPLVLMDPARTISYLEATAPSPGRTWSVCACVDVSTSTDREAVGLVHRFQARFGIALGPFGTEGWDAGTAIAAAASSRPTREGVADAVASLTALDGLARGYRLDRTNGPVYVYRATGARWLLVRGDA